MTIRKKFQLVFAGLLSAMMLSSIVNILAVQSVNSVTEVENRRLKSLQLADELRQSSDDLTRMARSFAATRKPRFERYFQDILDIRDGLIPYPDGYNGIFWDFMIPQNARLKNDGQSVSLKERMKRLSFSRSEFAKLEEAEANSNELAKLETIAMNAVKGQFDDGTGSFSVIRSPDQRLALSLLFGKQYHDAKAKIMKPIQDFFVLLEARTSAEIAAIRGQHKTIIFIAVGAIFMTLGLTIFAFFSMNRMVIAPLGSLRHAVEVFGETHGAVDMPAFDLRNEIGEIAAGFTKATGDVAAYISSINEAREELTRNEQELREREERMRSLLEVSPIGFTLARLSGELLLTNDALEKILKQPPGTTLSVDVAELYQDPEDRNRYVEILQRDGVVSGFETGWKQADGSPIWVTISSKLIEFDGDQAIMAWVDDITMRKETERLMDEQREMIQVVLDNMEQGFGMWDGNRDLLIVNDKLNSFVNLPPELLQKGTPVVDWFNFLAKRGDYHTNDQFGGDDIESRIALRLESLNHPLAFERKVHDGRICDLRRTLIPGGGHVTTYTDITERKLAEQKLAFALAQIQESIDYASNIQRSTLPPQEFLEITFADHFVIWEPRDVVGGDIYWLLPITDGVVLGVADCTGHGIPGAFVTLVASSAIRYAIDIHPDGEPAQVIASMNRFIKEVLAQYTDDAISDDGLELGLCRISRNGGGIDFAGARFSLWQAANGEFREIKGDKTGIGYCNVPLEIELNSHHLDADADSCFYLISDGFNDQVGGKKRRALGKKQLLKHLQDNVDEPMERQRTAVTNMFISYQGDEVRRDDITMVGFKL